MNNGMTLLNRIFSRPTLRNLLTFGYDDAYAAVVERYLPHLLTGSNRDVFTSTYEMLVSDYRNEYFYKNTIVNKVLSDRFNLNTATALSELPIGGSIADLIIINGTGLVYEIKTELDNLDRLENQVADYYKAFDQVCVITSESHYDKVEEIFAYSNVGVSVLTNDNAIIPKKPSKRDQTSLDSDVMFRILRKQEYETILLKHFGYLPDVVPVRHYRECKEMFGRISPIQAYEYMLQELRLRNQTDAQAFESVVPYELKSLVYFSGFRSRDYIRLREFLEGGLQDVFSIS